MALFQKNFLVFFIISIILHYVATNDSSINQNINQKIKGASAGSINQVISQDIKNDHCQKSNSSINQNINQDVESTHGQGPDCINQNIHQKVTHGSTLIDQKSFKTIKNHDKRSHSSCCGKEVIFKRHHSNCGCNNEDSSEEIKFCDDSHSSEIIFKNRGKNCGDLSESSSEEIQFKYGCNNKKKSCQYDTSEEIVLPKLVCRPCLPVPKCEDHKNEAETTGEYNDNSSSEEEIEVTKKYKKPCGLNCKNSEEWDIKTWIRPCEDYKRYDVSSEEKTCDCKPEEASTSEEKVCEAEKCTCKESSEEKSSKSCSCSEESSEESSEEVIRKVYKYTPYRRPAVQKSCSSCQKEPCACYKNGFYF